MSLSEDVHLEKENMRKAILEDEASSSNHLEKLRKMYSRKVSGSFVAFPSQSVPKEHLVHLRGLFSEETLLHSRAVQTSCEAQSLWRVSVEDMRDSRSETQLM